MNVPDIHQLRIRAWGVACVGVIATVCLSIGHTAIFFQSYLFVYVYLVALVLGSLGFALLYLLVGGKWGRPVRSILLAVVSTVPWTTLLFIPILIGCRAIYPWAQSLAAGESLGGHKDIFFKFPFYLGRSIFFWAGFNALALWAHKMLRYELDTGTPHAGSRQAGAVGVLSFMLLLSFASFDWIMSLEPHWYSSVYGALIMSGCALSALAFAVVVLYWLTLRYPGKFSISEDASQDLGNLILAFTMFWTYMSLSQYLIIWSGNLPEEISWYIARRDGGWRSLSTILFGGQFAYSFLILLGSERKRVLRRLMRVAYWVLAIRLLEAFWLTTPDYHPGKIVFHWMDLSVLTAMVSLWLASFFGHLKREAAL